MRRYCTQYVNANSETNTLPSAAQTVIYVFIFVFVGQSATPWAIQCPTSSLSMQKDGGAGRGGAKKKQFAWPTTADYVNDAKSRRIAKEIRLHAQNSNPPFVQHLILERKKLVHFSCRFPIRQTHRKYSQNDCETVHSVWVAGMACSMKTVNDFFSQYFVFGAAINSYYDDVFRRLLVFGNKMKYLFWREKKTMGRHRKITEKSVIVEPKALECCKNRGKAF